MAIRKIAQLGEPVLRAKAEPLPLDELGASRFQGLIDDMIETMRDADGAGLAAPQVYESVRLAVVEVEENPRYPTFEPVPLTVLVNPVVTLEPEPGTSLLSAETSVEMYEGCLSVPGVRGRVRRPRKARVSAFDRHGKPIEFEWEGVRAAIIQHELDHLDGVLFLDRADPRSLTFLKEYDRHVPLEARLVDRGVPVLRPSKPSS